MILSQRILLYESRLSDTLITTRRVLQKVALYTVILVVWMI
jgi:hypothetical protein